MAATGVLFSKLRAECGNILGKLFFGCLWQ